jgi:hypothetical protein
VTVRFSQTCAECFEYFHTFFLVFTQKPGVSCRYTWMCVSRYARHVHVFYIVVSIEKAKMTCKRKFCHSRLDKRCSVNLMYALNRM